MAAGMQKTLAPGAWSTTVTLAAMTAMGPLATDIYLPAMPALAADLGSSEARAQLTLSLFMLGFGIGQMLYGPVSDRFGRRPAILFGFALFTLGSIACALAPTMEALLAARVVQALGGAGPVVLGRAVVRDLYEGPEAGRELSRMATIMGLTPALAPMIGAGLLAFSGWRSNFALVAALGAALAIYVALRVPETVRRRSPGPLTPGSFFGSFGVLLAHPTFRIYLMINALSFAGLFAFISVGSFIMQGVYGLGPTQFAGVFGVGCLCFMAGASVSSRVMRRYGFSRSIAIGVACLCAGGLGMLAGALSSSSPFALVGPMLLYWVGIGFTLPASTASALAPIPERAGAASSLLGVSQMLFAALVGAILGHSLSGSALPLPIATAITGTGALALFLLTRRARARHG